MNGDLRAQVRAERAAQGLPERLDDSDVVDRAVSVLLSSTAGPRLLDSRGGGR